MSEGTDLTPVQLDDRIASLTQMVMTETGVFIAAFFAVTQTVGGNWWWFTSVCVAFFMAGLLWSGIRLLILHSPKGATHASRLSAYGWAWKTFLGANAIILGYFVFWWFHVAL